MSTRVLFTSKEGMSMEILVPSALMLTSPFIDYTELWNCIAIWKQCRNPYNIYFAIISVTGFNTGFEDCASISDSAVEWTY